jgi:CDI toxin RNase A-like protein
MVSNQAAINGWLAGHGSSLEFVYSFSHNVGVSLVRGSETLIPASRVLVTLVRDTGSALGYYIVRAYPIL